MMESMDRIAPKLVAMTAQQGSLWALKQNPTFAWELGLAASLIILQDSTHDTGTDKENALERRVASVYSR